VHRSNFVYREPTLQEIGQHKTAFKLAIRTCLFINSLIADPDFHEPGLVSLLQVRIRQLQDAYDTFHDTTLSEEDSDETLRLAFKE
jgi:hypothetical protein